MKKYFVTITVVAVALVPSAFAVNSSLNSRVAKLERQVRTITAQANAANTRLRAVEVIAACLASSRPVALTIYGNPQGNEGYVYRSPTQGEFLSTALDVTEQGDTPAFIAPTLNPQCVGSSANAASKASRRSSAEPRRVSWKPSIRVPSP